MPQKSRKIERGICKSENIHNFDAPTFFAYNTAQRGIDMKTTPKTVIMAVLFAVSAFTFTGKVLMPTPIQIVIPGEEPSS